jgi:hypothetical protein
VPVSVLLLLLALGTDSLGLVFLSVLLSVAPIPLAVAGGVLIWRRER